MRVGFVLVRDFKRVLAGSSRIRGDWVIKHWPAAEVYRDGVEYDAIVFQKAYWHKKARTFKGLKILGGKMKNPLYRVGKSELLWDPDLNPEGAAIGYKRQFSFIEPYITGVAYFL